MNNVQYRSLQRALTPKSLRVQISGKNKMFSSSGSLNSATLFSLVIRQIFNAKVLSSFNAIRNEKKKRYYKLQAINVMIKRRLILGLHKINNCGQKLKNAILKKQLKRANFQSFLIRSSEKLSRKTFRFAFHQILLYRIKKSADLSKLQQSFHIISNALERGNKRTAFKRIKLVQKKIKLKKLTIKPLYSILSQLLKKNLKQSFRCLKIISSQKDYEQLYITSQNKKKQLSDFETKQLQQLSKQQQNIQKLKQTIDKQTNQINKKTSQLKQQKTIKSNQYRLKIQTLHKEIEEKDKQYRKIEKQQEKCDQMIEKRIRLSLESKGSEEKIRNLFNELKFEVDEEKDGKSSVNIKIVLNKEKFINILTEDFEKFRQSEDFEIFVNIIQRNIICVYENISIDNPPPSEEYSIALQENRSLKQSLSSLISFQLLMGEGDKNLQERSQNLESLFEDMFLFLQEKGNEKRQQQGKTSFFSCLSSKSLKSLKKSPNKFPTKSNKSFK